MENKELILEIGESLSKLKNIDIASKGYNDISLIADGVLRPQLFISYNDSSKDTLVIRDYDEMLKFLKTII